MSRLIEADVLIEVNVVAKVLFPDLVDFDDLVQLGVRHFSGQDVLDSRKQRQLVHVDLSQLPV